MPPTRSSMVRAFVFARTLSKSSVFDSPSTRKYLP